jgi:hypothetical protein
VGSSRRSRSGSPPRARASEARVSSPPENVASGRSRSVAATPRVAAGVLEPRLDLAVAAQRGRAVVARGHRVLEPAQLGLGGDEIGGAGEDVLAKRQLALERRPLVVQRDTDALVEDELAALQLRLPDERAEQRRLAGAVGAGEGEPVAALELERDPVEERVAGELLAEVRCDQHGHRPTA